MEQSSIINSFGTEGKTLEETIKSADLDWAVEEDKVHGATSAVIMPNKKLLYRSDNGAPLGIVGAEYVPTDPRTFVKSQFDLAERIKGKVTRVGFIGDRSRAFSFIHIADIKVPHRNRKVGDGCRAYLYTTDGWDGGTPHKSRLYVERLVCSNGMTSQEIKARLWVSHTKGMAARLGVHRKSYLEVVQDSLVSIKATFAHLAKVKMTQEQVDEFLKKLIPGESTMTVNRRDSISKLFTQGIGTHGETRWDAYNAVTQYVTHQRSYRGNEQTSVDTNRFLGVLETDTLAPRALDLLSLN